MAEEGYYELQVMDLEGWKLRSRFPTSEDDPLVLMRARAEAEQAAQEGSVRGVELVYECIDPKTNDIRRDSVFSWGANRHVTASGASPGPGTSGVGSGTRAKPVARRAVLARRRAAILRAAVRAGRAGPPAPRRPTDDSDVPREAAPAAAAVAERRTRLPRRLRRLLGNPVVAVLGSLAVAAGATALIWIGLEEQVAKVEALDPRPLQAGLFTVLALGCLVVLFLAQRGGLVFARETPASPVPEGVGAPSLGLPEMPPEPPPGAKARPVDPASAMVDVQQTRLLRFLRECLLQKAMREAMGDDGTLRDPHIVYGCHLFLLGSAEVCVTDHSGVSDRSHLVKVLTALLRAIGSPQDRAEAFLARIDAYRNRPAEHTMILLGQLAMDHYLEYGEVQEGALSSALTRWSTTPADD